MVQYPLIAGSSPKLVGGQLGPPTASVTEPSAAPSENSRYWKELLSERMIGALFSPTMPDETRLLRREEAHAVHKLLPPYARAHYARARKAVNPGPT